MRWRCIHGSRRIHAVAFLAFEINDQLSVGVIVGNDFSEAPATVDTVSPGLHGFQFGSGGHVEGYPDTFRALFKEVYQDVANGEPALDLTYPTFADGLDALLVTEAVARSSEEQRWVTVAR